MFKNQKILIPSIIIISILVLVGIYFIPPVNEQLAWRFENLRAEIFYAFNPPEQVVFHPTQQAELSALVENTLTAMAPKLTATLVLTATSTNYISPTPSQTPLPSATPTQLPKAVRLEGITHEYQKFNNCGPANLSMALSYWGWEGDQYVTAAYLKPNQQDRNVMPYEMVDFVETQTGLNAILRYGGDLDLIQRFVAAGFPVLVERGYYVSGKGWMGHYGVIAGYDDGKKQFFIPDSYEG
ncbi:MAG: C39 family peptidase, partial [Chloroflexota bacterium]